MRAVRNRPMTPKHRRGKWGLLVACATLAAALSIASPARAQMTVVPERSQAWNDATTIMALSALGLELVMPRVFYSDPEVTAGWKARWHLSAFAPA